MKQKRYAITTKKVLSHNERENLVRVLSRTLHLNHEGRNGLMLTLILECGLRASELLNLKVRDFNFDLQQVFIESLKGSNARELPLRPSRARELKRFLLWKNKAESLGQINPDSFIFDIGYTRLYQLWLWYRPNSEKTLHCLRHTFAVNLYEKTKDVKIVQLALGHRNIQNTMVYLDFAYSQTVLRKVMIG